MVNSVFSAGLAKVKRMAPFSDLIVVDLKFLGIKVGNFASMLDPAAKSWKEMLGILITTK